MCAQNIILKPSYTHANITIAVPDDWASVDITNSTGENALHDTEYTLLCTVTVIPSMKLPPTVEWVGPGGDVIEGSDGNRTVSAVVTQGTVSTLSLTFNPVFSSDGGRYTCRASINAPLVKEPSNISTSVHMVVTS